MRSLIIYTLHTIIRVIKLRKRWVEHVAGMGKMRYAYNILVGKSKRKRSLGRHRCRRDDNIRMGLSETVQMRGLDAPEPE
jgi:hypothetical protein